MSLIKKINNLKKEPIKKTIDERIHSFSKIKNSTNNQLFKELSFCVLTANYNAKKAIEIQKKINNGFITFSESKLKKELASAGYRYPNKRAEYIIYNRSFLKDLTKIINLEDRRDVLVKKIKGFGYKEASHFLRNIGFNNYAIIDFHIIDVLIKNKYLKEKPRVLTKKKYFEIENILLKISKKVKLSQGELDFYLWYLETGAVLK